MNVLLHTIALEPARWTPARVSRNLVDLLAPIRAAGFLLLEVYEPHLALAPDETGLVAAFARHGLTPVVLSSYLDLSPAATPRDSLLEQVKILRSRVTRLGFRKVRLFPGRSPSPERNNETVELIAQRLRLIADALPDVEFLLETHDHSLADNPGDVIRLIEACERPNIGLLWQPTIFELEATRSQFAIQRTSIRHLHLQNRHPNGSFAPLSDGVIPWREFLKQLPPDVDATLEFVPSGICAPEKFDLETSLREAVEERDYAQGISVPQNA